jgi:hypothetical protein
MKTLTNIIYQYKYEKFNWGKFDCCIFCAKVLEEYKNIRIPYWNDKLYTNKYGALKTIKNLGAKDLNTFPTVVLNTKRKSISEAKLADIVYYINEENEGILGICNGAQSYFLAKGEGLVTRKTKDCLYCWSVD